MNKIDFVVMWVDGGDPIWQAKKAEYSKSVDTSKNSMNSVKACLLYTSPSPRDS